MSSKRYLNAQNNPKEKLLEMSIAQRRNGCAARLTIFDLVDNAMPLRPRGQR